MFDILAQKKFLMVLPLAASILLTACKEEEANAAPEPDSVDIAATEDLFSDPVQPNPLANDPDAVAIRVNGKEITRGEIMEVMNRAMQQFAGRVPPEQLQQLQGRMLEQIKNDLINKTLIDGAVKKADIEVTDEGINEALEQIRGRIPEGQSLEDIIAAQGQTMEQVKEELKSDLRVQKFMEQKTDDVAEATEEEAREFYESNPDRFVIPETADASHILIKFGEEETEESKGVKKAALEKIRADIIAGDITFADAAKEHSDDPGSKDTGGEYTGIERGQMVPEFDAATFTQEIGEIGDIIETQFGYHVIKVSNRTEAGTVPFEEVKEELITALTNQKKQEVISSYIQTLRDSATIEEIGI